jgi:CO/xanthine dehydrogenase FAD-binding subunit
MVMWNAGRLNGRTILDLSLLKEWRRIRRKGNGLSVGSLVSHWQIRNHPAIQKHLPLLAQASATVGGMQIQVRGTLGGNIANASPAGDTFPPLAVYEAMVHTVSNRGTRAVPFMEIFAGVKKTTLQPAELIESIAIPIPHPRPTRQMFRKVGTRTASAISKTVVSGLLWLKRDGTIRTLRFSVGSMAPTVRRLTSVESYLAGKKPTKQVLEKACRVLADDVSPIDDIRSTADYRLEVTRNLLCEFLRPNYQRR